MPITFGVATLLSLKFEEIPVRSSKVFAIIHGSLSVTIVDVRFRKCGVHGKLKRATVKACGRNGTSSQGFE